MKDPKLELAEYRLQRAFETMEEAVALIRGNKSRGAINRLYYSVFYATRALLATKGLDYAKHSGVITFFQKEFIKTRLISVESGKTLVKAFKLRSEGDYQDFKEFNEEEVLQLHQECRKFLDEVSIYLSSLS
ncbi:hypothetical protein SY88_03285 [Clostridiales bacterium PH28_bin88]|nr:hypothetical protein SY88_03285 [Clostridiales bacterium PH28_bin88]